MTTMCHVKKNAFLAICKACNDEMRPIDRGDLTALAEVIGRHGKRAELLGFSVTEMKRQIGVINGVLRCRD